MLKNTQSMAINAILDGQKNITAEDREAIFRLCSETKGCLLRKLLQYSISEANAAKMLAELYECEFSDASSLEPLWQAVSLLPELAASRLNVLPLSFENNVLSIALSDPSDISVISELKLLCGNLKIHVVPETELRERIKVIYGLYSSSEVLRKGRETDDDGGSVSILFSDSDNSPAAAFVDYILNKAVSDNASDIHFEPMEKCTRVRYRIDGTLFDLINFDAALHKQIASRLKIVSGINVAEKRHPMDGRIFYMHRNNKVDIRVSTLPTIYGEKVVLRLLKQDSSMFELGNLGFEKEDIDILQRAIQCDSGLILMAGPTGSGKSTTLHAIMRKLNNVRSNIISIEDPVEYTIEGVNQVQVNDEIGFSFSNILRSVLRQDPDKIMIGEIRDIDTAQLAVRAALTGHLVLSTVHADNTAGAVSRLLDMGIQPYLLAASLKYVIAQRLVRKLCNHCKTEFVPDEKTASLLHAGPGIRIAKANGCEHCRYSGTYGRTVIAETLVVDNAVKEMIISGASAGKMLEYAKSCGMRTLGDALCRKIISSEVSADELYMFNLE